MLTRNFGASSLQVSALGFGAGHIGKVRVPGYSGENEALAWAASAGVLVAMQSDDWQGTALRFSAFTPGVSTAIVGTSRTANLEAAAAAVERGPLPVTERARWENAFAPQAGVWAGEV